LTESPPKLLGGFLVAVIRSVSRSMRHASVAAWVYTSSESARNTLDARIKVATSSIRFCLPIG